MAELFTKHTYQTSIKMGLVWSGWLGTAITLTSTYDGSFFDNPTALLSWQTGGVSRAGCRTFPCVCVCVCVCLDSSGGVLENKVVFWILDKITSIFRAVPFIILLAVLSPSLI